MRLNKLQKTAVTALEDIKARDITVLDVRKLTSLYDTLIIASADSNRQVKALAHHVRDKLKEAGATIIGVEGEETGEWVLVDCGDIVVHVMQPAVRAYYNLEELWDDRAPSRAPRRRPSRRHRAAAMKLRIVALGHRMPAWVDAGYDDYARRLPRDFAARPGRAQARAARPRQDRRADARRRSACASRAACEGCRDRRARRARRARGPRASCADRLARWRDDARRRRVRHRQRRRPRPRASSATPTRVVALSALTLPHGARRA